MINWEVHDKLSEELMTTRIFTSTTHREKLTLPPSQIVQYLLSPVTSMYCSLLPIFTTCDFNVHIHN